LPPIRNAAISSGWPSSLEDEADTQRRGAGRVRPADYKFPLGLAGVAAGLADASAG
jgi:hypothetical protein